MKSISVIIPTYEMHGLGVHFLDFSLQKLKAQSFQDFDVIVSDHSCRNGIMNLCNIWSKLGLDIKYVRNFYDRGSSSSNLNFGMELAKGKYVKILFQDDFLFDNQSLEHTFTCFESAPDAKWLVTPSEHSYDGFNMFRTHIPHYHDEIHLGGNSISSPSVLTLRNGHLIKFDPNLIWLMDVEYYKRLHCSFGSPAIMDRVTVVNRCWDRQLSHTIPVERKNAEHEYVKKLYG